MEMLRRDKPIRWRCASARADLGILTKPEPASNLKYDQGYCLTRSANATRSRPNHRLTGARYRRHMTCASAGITFKAFATAAHLTFASCRLSAARYGSTLRHRSRWNNDQQQQHNKQQSSAKANIRSNFDRSDHEVSPYK
jgi:hypothetical protein